MNSLQHYFAEAISSSKGLGKYQNQDQEDPSTWSIGNILCAVFGSTIYRPRFYKIIRRTSKSFVCVQLEGHVVSGSKSSQWQEVATDKLVDNTEYIARIIKGRVKLDGETLSLWDGNPLYGDIMD